MFEDPISTELIDYVRDLFVPADETFQAMTEASRAAGMPHGWEISPDVGRLFQMLCALIGARRVLEFGTFAGHSALWFARALPADGKVVSIEINPEYAAFARARLTLAGAADKVEIRVRPALEAIVDIDAEVRAGGEKYDVIFLDTEKAYYPRFLEWAPSVLRAGGLLLADNVLRSPSWKGQTLLDPASDDARIIAIREFNRRLAEHPNFSATIIPLRAGVAVGVYMPTRAV
jgi:predicted O-methyltransferase YrrM